VIATVETEGRVQPAVFVVGLEIHAGTSASPSIHETPYVADLAPEVQPVGAEPRCWVGVAIGETDSFLVVDEPVSRPSGSASRSSTRAVAPVYVPMVGLGLSAHRGLSNRRCGARYGRALRVGTR